MPNNLKPHLNNLASRVTVEKGEMSGDVCQICNDTGLRYAEPGEIISWRSFDGSSTTITVQPHQVKMFNITCEACLPKRNEAQRSHYQEISGMTEAEREHRLKNIITNAKTPGTAAMKQAAQELVDGKTFMLTIYGSNGNAKTLALMAIVNEMLDKGIPAMYVTASDMLEWIRDAFNSDGSPKDGGGSAFERLERLKGIMCLAVDELQAIKETAWTTEKLDNLVDARYRRAIAGDGYTVFAMNEHPEGLSSRIYSRLKDRRLRADGESPIIENLDPDLREHLKRR